MSLCALFRCHALCTELPQCQVDSESSADHVKFGYSAYSNPACNLYIKPIIMVDSSTAAYQAMCCWQLTLALCLCQYLCSNVSYLCISMVLKLS